MALSGPQALRSLDDAVRDIRREENDISARLARSAERVAKLREAEADLFRQLAGFRLTSAARGEVLTPLTRAEKNAHKLIEQHGVDIERLEKELADLDKKIADHARKRNSALSQIDEAQVELKNLSSRIASEIAKDPDYASKKQAAEEMQAVASESMRKTELAEKDREEKGKPYRDDPLFMYLWEAGYGTRNYKANNLVRWLDGMIARLVRYQDARPNFAMLNDIPLRLREHAERQVQLAQDAERALDKLEESAVDAAGGEPMRAALLKAQARLEKLDAEMVELEDARDDLATEYRHLAEGRDPAFDEAIRMLAQSLEGESLGRLLDQARQTPNSADDAIVVKIEDARARVAEEESETVEDKARLKTLAKRRRELEDIEFEFKKARFDDPRSTFKEDNLAGDLLNEFLRGAITAGTYWGHWQRSQRWSPGTTDWGGGIGLPRSGRGKSGGFTWSTGSSGSSPWVRSSGGGFSRPRSGSRGSRKSGGFKTGGGF